MIEKAGLHRQALSCYYGKQWHEAVLLFDRILEIDREDGVAAWYGQRCREFLRNPPANEGWQVIKMKEK